MLCTHKTTILCQFGLFCHQLTTISPSILNHFRWELYQYSRAEINRITKYLTNIKLDDTWRGTNESFLMHYNDQLRLLDSLVDSGEKLPDNARVTFLESAIESVPDLRCVKITDIVLQAQLGSTRPISYRSYFDLLKDAAFH